jgi:hypothetical protein
MFTEALFIVVVFVIVVILGYYTDNLTTFVLIASLSANFFAINNNIKKWKKTVSQADFSSKSGETAGIEGYASDVDLGADQMYDPSTNSPYAIDAGSRSPDLAVEDSAKAKETGDTSAAQPASTPGTQPAAAPSPSGAMADVDANEVWYNQKDQARDYHREYITGYTSAYEPKRVVSAMGTGLETVHNIDSAAVLMAQRRTRDKQAIDGNLTKDVDYYRYHFGAELRNEENKPWWGRGEY